MNQYGNGHGIIIDEFQYVPDLLSYIQIAVDEKCRPGYFVLTGSQNFLMNQAITQSLAGRVGILTLLPFSIHELAQADRLPERAFDLVVGGGYPRIYADGILPSDFYVSYINTYIERDVRQLTNVGDLSMFQMFLSLCAGRVGQLLNLSEIVGPCGISVPTETRWLYILEVSYILFRLQQYFKNFNKRMIKSPKLYFYDTGLACNLLRIASSEVLALSPFRGPLFENLIIADLFKQFYNDGKWSSLYFWRDRNARLEVDGVVDTGKALVPIEIKSSETISPSFFDALLKWNALSNTPPEDNVIVYSGHENQKRKNGIVLGWQLVGTLLDRLR